MFCMFCDHKGSGPKAMAARIHEARRRLRALLTGAHPMLSAPCLQR